MLSRGQSHEYLETNEQPVSESHTILMVACSFLPFLFILTMYQGSSMHSTSRPNIHWAHCANPRRVASPSMVHDAVWRLARIGSRCQFLPTWAHHSWHTQSTTSAPQHSTHQCPTPVWHTADNVVQQFYPSSTPYPIDIFRNWRTTATQTIFSKSHIIQQPASGPSLSIRALYNQRFTTAEE
jgi:hypothetical protein